jgi:prevent-host-death family protein
MSKAAEKKVKEVAISEFKAKCLSLVDQVNKTKTPLRITRRGKALADVVPVQTEQAGSWIGSMVGTGKILGDIVSPAADPEDWEVLRD